MKYLIEMILFPFCLFDSIELCSLTLNLESNELLILRELTNLCGIYNYTYSLTRIQLLHILRH